MTDPRQPEYLDATELHQLTGSARAKGQAAWLAERAIPHKVDGRRIIVSRVHVRLWIEGRPVVSSSGPNWAAVT
jgi:hypothetical protein